MDGVTIIEKLSEKTFEVVKNQATYIMKIWSDISDENGLKSNLIKNTHLFHLNHPYVSKIHDIKIDLNCVNPYDTECTVISLNYLTDFGDGNLRHYMDTKRYSETSEKDIMTYTQNILEALSYFHQNNINHGNLTPENIILVRYNDALIPKITDIEESIRRTFKPMVFDHYRFFLGDDDVWSFGLILYELLFQEKLFGSFKDIWDILGTPDVSFEFPYKPHKQKRFKEYIFQNASYYFNKSRFKDKTNFIKIICVIDACLRYNKINPDKIITNVLHGKTTIYPDELLPDIKIIRSDIRKNMVLNLERDVEIGEARYYPSVYAVFLYDFIRPYFKEEDAKKLMNVCYFIGMKIYYPETVISDIQGVVTVLEPLDIIMLEKEIVRKTNLNFYASVFKNNIKFESDIFKRLKCHSLK